MSDEEQKAWSDHLIQARIGDNGYPEVRISAFRLEGPYHFGRFIADVARHGAKAYATTYNLDESKALEEICRGLSDQFREQDSSIEMISPGGLDS